MAKLTPEAMEGFVADPRMHYAEAIAAFEAEEETPDWRKYWGKMIANGWAWSVAKDDGAIAGACGLYTYDAEKLHAEMWAVFSPDAGPLMVGVTRRTLAVLDAARGQLALIRAHVGRSFPQARKWVLLLGFEPSGESFEGHGDIYDRYVWKG